MQRQEVNIVGFIIIVSVITLLLTVFVVAILLKHQRKKVDFKNQLKKAKEEHENILLSTQLEIQEQTLQYVAREIHDNIGLSLTLAKLNLNTINQKNFEPIIADKIEGTVDQITKALEDLSRLSKTLNHDHIADDGLIKALEMEMSKIEKLKLYDTRLEITGTPIFLDAQKELVIFRIIQESLNNSIRHAKASTLLLRLEYSTTHLSVLVQDNGTGWTKKSIIKEPGYSGGSGLKNMQQRAKLINGECKFESSPSNGTTVYLTIPI
jgi:two-component system, NarL family, sensor kinase